SKSASRPERSALARATIVGPYCDLKCSAWSRGSAKAVTSMIWGSSRRRLRARWRRWGERADDPEERADHALRGPVQQRDGAAWAAHPDELVGRSLVARREHHAHARQHDVELAVAEGKLLRVARDPLQLEPGRLRAAAPGFQQLGRQIARRDPRPTSRRRQRRVAGPGADVQDAHAGRDAGGGCGTVAQ